MAELLATALPSAAGFGLARTIDRRGNRLRVLPGTRLALPDGENAALAPPAGAASAP
jgi:hypothetical protein